MNTKYKGISEDNMQKMLLERDDSIESLTDEIYHLKQTILGSCAYGDKLHGKIRTGTSNDYKDTLILEEKIRKLEEQVFTQDRVIKFYYNKHNHFKLDKAPY